MPTRRRRLLAVCAVAEPGGAETTLLRLLHRLDGERWQITLSMPGEGSLASATSEAGWDVELLDPGPLEPRLPGVPSARALASWPRARQLGRGADVVYLNGGACGRLLPALARLRPRPRLVLHLHDLVERVPRFWRHADAVLVPTAAVAERLPGLDPIVVWCPVDPDPPAVTPPWPASDGPVVGFVGRLEPRKGAIDLVAAIPAIKAKVPGARVVIVGSDTYRANPDYVAQVRTGTVEHYGWMPQAAGLMRHLDVLVLPSYNEPFGTVLAEAMAVGTPVVATRVGGLPEVVEDGVSGALIDPGEPDQIASAVATVLARRAELSQGALRVAARFHADAYARRVEPLLSGATTAAAPPA